MDSPVSASAFRVNFKKIFRRIALQGGLFLFVFSVSIVVIFPLKLPAVTNLAVLLFVLVADVIVLIFQVRKILNDNNEIATTVTLMETGLQEKTTDNDEIRMISFGNIRNYSLGTANYPEEQNYFRIKLKNTNDEIYMTTAETDKQEFFFFTAQFIEKVEHYNVSLPMGSIGIKKIR